MAKKLKKENVIVTIVPKDYCGEKKDLYKAHCEGMENGWGFSMKEALSSYCKINGL